MIFSRDSRSSRLELSSSRTAQVKDAASARTPRWVTLAAALLGLLVPAANAASAQAAAPQWKLTVTPAADYFIPDTATQHAEYNVYTIEAENVGGAPTSSSEPIVLKDTLPAGLVPLGDVFPPGLAPSDVQFYSSSVGSKIGPANPPSDLESACPSALECRYPSGPDQALLEEHPLGPGQKLVMQLRVDVPIGFQGQIEDRVEITGGGAATAEASAVNQVDAEPPLGSGFHAFNAPITDSACDPNEEPEACHDYYTQAGGHPYQFTTEMDFTTRTYPAALGSIWGEADTTPIADPKDISAELPPGLIGNPQAVPRCSLAAFFFRECELKHVVGTVGVLFGSDQAAFNWLVPLFNLQPAGAYPGELGYQVNGIPFFLTATLRSASDYGLTITNLGTPPVGLSHTYVTTWGVPAAPAHDALRGKTCRGKLSGTTSNNEWFEEFSQSPAQAYLDCEAGPGSPLGTLHGGPAGVPPTPFLTMPSDCTGEPLSVGARYDTWEQVGGGEEGHATATDPPVEGCDQLKFEPTIEAHPTTNLADSPSGLEFDLHVPQGCWGPEASPGFEAFCQSNLTQAVVKLPAGLTVNPSSAGGLVGCSPAQIGLTTPVGQMPAHFTETPAACPDAAKIGEARVDTPLLHNPLEGSVYLATPRQNPFGSLLAGYIVLEGEGVIIKLPGKIETDPVTGQITGSFAENPQQPFEDFHLKFFGGARGNLRTPATCGSYETTSQLTPYSHTEVNGQGEEVEATPIAAPTSEFETSSGPGGAGSPCAATASELPNAPVLRAGTESPEAGRFTPFSLRLAREDGSQEISKIETTLPPGLTGKLAGVTECSDAQLAVAQSREHEGGGAEEQASPACPSASEIGTVEVASGAGPTPLHVTGHAYLAGPYKGAPLSLAIVTPAVAGPFDLGDVLVRTALYVDPLTTQIKAVSDPIPHILQGIPLDVRSITLKMSRPNFTLNPTNCSEFHLTGSETSVLGRSAALSQRFQVGGCAALPFKPNLKISLKGSTRHAGHPALKAVLTYPKGGPYADVASAQVNLPHSEFIDQANLNKTCTKPVLLEGACPATSVYGKAKAWSPLLEKPLEGPVYLVGGFGYKLPALVAELDGQIRVLLVGKVDSGKNKGIRNTFEAVPDAPVEKFVLEMKGGPKYSLLENSENLCSRPQKAIASFTAQSGKVLDLHPTVANDCKGGKGKGKSHQKTKGARKSEPSNLVGTSHR